MKVKGTVHLTYLKANDGYHELPYNIYLKTSYVRVWNYVIDKYIAIRLGLERSAKLNLIINQFT